jgi:carbonic anhydrase
VLGIEHVIVCGHYGCGGVLAAYEQRALGLVDNWLLPIRDIARLYAPQLAELPGDAERADRLCELNVLFQARRVCRTTIVQQAWERGHPLTVHAWVYRLNDGLLRDLGFCATDLLSADADFERTTGTGTVAR